MREKENKMMTDPRRDSSHNRERGSLFWIHALQRSSLHRLGHLHACMRCVVLFVCETQWRTGVTLTQTAQTHGKQISEFWDFFSVSYTHNWIWFRVFFFSILFEWPFQSQCHSWFSGRGTTAYNLSFSCKISFSIEQYSNNADKLHWSRNR